MNSAELEEKARREREELEKSIRDLNQDLSPGQLLDDYYFHGEGFTGYLKRLQDDPVPGALVGAAIAWSAGREEIKGAGARASSAAREGMHKAGDKLAETREHARGKASGVRSRAATAGESAKARAGEVRVSAGEKASHAREKVGEKAGEVAERGRQAMEEGRTAMREHPLMAIAVGFSLGAALGGLAPVSPREREALAAASGKLKGAGERIRGDGGSQQRMI